MELPQGFWYDTVDSTMDEARRLIQQGKIQGTAFVLAHHQTQGRGTHGRHWTSPGGAGIYLSVVHVAPEDAKFEITPLYTLAAGVACAEALKLSTQVEVQLKPINDLYSQGKKLGGILVESDLHQHGMSCLITGVGINTHTVPRTLDRQGAEPIALQDLMHKLHFANLSHDVLVETLVAKICFWHGLVFNSQHGQVVRAWNQHKLPEAPDYSFPFVTDLGL
jgi:biotin-[acetyl-CoA-carboxylase] ligase BirA-like protein